MINEAIILAGGFGTRLKKVVKGVPKPMVNINERPFLEYLLNYLIEQGIEKVILAVGFKFDVIQRYFKNQYKKLTLEYSVEKEPLGTGGAIKKALKLTKTESIFIFNGDTFFNIDLSKLYKFHRLKNTDLTIALKIKKNTNRFGSIDVDAENRIVHFEEKQPKKSGFINGGTYIINKGLFEKLNLVEKFSFEKDLLEKYYKDNNFYGLPFDKFFIDIGIPKDYEKVKKEFKKMVRSIGI
ncbi:MAG: nucleotidyltransferase family protein [bacterium]